MEEKKKTNEKEVTMVECPFCNKPIEAPAKADVIFKCPHCHKELITYDKVAEQEKKHKQKAEQEKNIQNSNTQKQILKWAGIVAFISLFLYISITDNVDMNATYIVTQDYDAAINVDTEKALVKAATDDDKMKTLEIIGNRQTIHFYSGDLVRITKSTVRGLPDHYKIKRVSDGASALMPKKYLIKK